MAVIKRTQMSGIVLGFYYRYFQVLLNQKVWNNKEHVDYEGREGAIRFKQLLHQLTKD